MHSLRDLCALHKSPAQTSLIDRLKMPDELYLVVSTPAGLSAPAGTGNAPSPKKAAKGNGNGKSTLKRSRPDQTKQENGELCVALSTGNNVFLVDKRHHEIGKKRTALIEELKAKAKENLEPNDAWHHFKDKMIDAKVQCVGKTFKGTWPKMCLPEFNWNKGVERAKSTKKLKPTVLAHSMNGMNANVVLSTEMVEFVGEIRQELHTRNQLRVWDHQ